MNSPAQVQFALQSVWQELADLLGPADDEFAARVLPFLRAIDESPGDSARLDALLAFLEAEFPAVYDRMVDTLALASVTARYRSTSLAVRPAYGRYMVVPVWYATDRHHVPGGPPAERYTGDRGRLRFGRLEVSIPDRHEKGRLEKPRWFRLEFRPDPERHVVLLSVEEAESADWAGEIKAKLGVCSRRDVLLFIHGYNTGFEDAARRAAQFAYDLEFQGIPVLYTWPSEGKTLRYTVDEDNAQWTVDHFEEVLHALMVETGAACVHAVAHSMGSRVLAEGIRRFDNSALPADSARLCEVVFAAPDINAETFRNFVRKFAPRADRVTLYASNGDRALEVSRTIHKYPRAGHSGDGIVLCERLETVDASAVDNTVLGHSYFCDNRVIVQDMFNLIMKGESAATPRYGLKTCETPEGCYWALAP